MIYTTKHIDGFKKQYINSYLVLLAYRLHLVWNTRTLMSTCNCRLCSILYNTNYIRLSCRRRLKLEITILLESLKSTGQNVLLIMCMCLRNTALKSATNGKDAKQTEMNQCSEPWNEESDVLWGEMVARCLKSRWFSLGRHGVTGHWG